MQIIILIILILVNAYFAASEIAFISLNDTKIEKMAKEGNKKAIQIEKMLKNPSRNNTSRIPIKCLRIRRIRK